MPVDPEPRTIKHFETERPYVVRVGEKLYVVARFDLRPASRALWTKMLRTSLAAAARRDA